MTACNSIMTALNVFLSIVAILVVLALLANPIFVSISGLHCGASCILGLMVWGALVLIVLFLGGHCVYKRCTQNDHVSIQSV